MAGRAVAGHGPAGAPRPLAGLRGGRRALRLGRSRRRGGCRGGHAGAGAARPAGGAAVVAETGARLRGVRRRHCVAAGAAHSRLDAAHGLLARERSRAGVRADSRIPGRCDRHAAEGRSRAWGHRAPLVRRDDRPRPGDNRWSDALDWAERGLEAFPDSADLLAAQGAIEETYAARSSARLETSSRPMARSDAANLARAASRAGTCRRRSLRCGTRSPPTPHSTRPGYGLAGWPGVSGDAEKARAELAQVLARPVARHRLPGAPLPGPGPRGRGAARRRRARPTRPLSRSSRAASRPGSH